MFSPKCVLFVYDSFWELPLQDEIVCNSRDECICFLLLMMMMLVLCLFFVWVGNDVH